MSDYTQTPNLRLYKPNYDADAEQWGNHLNHNSDTLDNAIYTLQQTTAGVASFNGRQGAVTLQLADVTSVGGAPLASPNLSGTPTSTTPAPGDNSTRIATTAFMVALNASYAPLASPALTGTPTAPTPAATDSSTALATTAFAQSAINAAGGRGNIGRNLIHNALFNVWQRGAGPWTASNNYTADRWVTGLSLDTMSVSAYYLTDAERAQIGDESVQWVLRNTFAGNAGAASYNDVAQYIERVKRLSGKTVTVSFWARAGTASLKLGVSLTQNFGTGGSPSPSVNMNGQAVTLTTTFARYSLTFTLPSTSGMTLGSNGDDRTALWFWFSGGSNANALTGGIGVQSGVVDLWGVQLEIGSVATPLEKLDPGEDLKRCQRFFQFMPSTAVYAYGPAGAGIVAPYYLPVTMRAVPTAALANQSYSNASAFAYNYGNTTSVRFSATVTTAGMANAFADVSLSADL